MHQREGTQKLYNIWLNKVPMSIPKVSVFEIDQIREKLIYCLGGQALVYASGGGYQEIVKYLIEHGADANTQGEYN